MKNLWFHRFAIVVAVCTLALVAAGATVTSEGAGLSVPDWPLSFGRIWPSLSGAGVFEQTHRLLATVAGLLIVILAAGLWIVESRRWVKWLGAVTVLLVGAQAALGGMAVLLALPKWIGVAHACLAQMCLAIVAALARVTSPDWAEAPEYVNDYGWPTLRSMAIWVPLLVFAQIFLGALFRYNILGPLPHIFGALLVTVVILMFGLFVMTQFPRHENLKRWALAALLTVFGQVMLGVFTYMDNPASADQLAPSVISVVWTVAHVATGGVLFALSVVLGLEVRRNVLPKGMPLPAVRIQAVS